MPAKKKEVKVVKEPAAKKNVKAAAPKNTAEKKEVKVEEKPVVVAKKTAAKPAVKAVEKKPAAKKTAAKKTTTKKAAPAKKAEEKKEVVKKSFQEYKDVINWKKWEAHNMNWLYIEVNAGDLMTELEAGVDNIETCAGAILDCMLEGDHFIVEPKSADRISTELTVRYYCDNLSEDRRKWADVQ